MNTLLKAGVYQEAIFLVFFALVLVNVHSLVSDVKESAESREKRASSFVRIGKGGQFSEDAEGRSDEFSLASDGLDGASRLKKLSNFVRIGRRENSPEDGYSEEDGDSYGDVANQLMRLPELVRLGKKASSFVRIGKSDADGNEESVEESKEQNAVKTLEGVLKRASSFVRIGKNSNFVRIGKSAPHYHHILRMPRAPMFVRIGRSGLSEFDDLPEKRKVSSFVRIGKGDFSHDNDELFNTYPTSGNVNRKSSFVRIGKSDLYNEKRPSSFVRIGKSSMDKLEDYISSHKAAKKAHSFVRIGKRDEQHPAYPAYMLSNSNFVTNEAPAPASVKSFEDIDAEEAPTPEGHSPYSRLGKIPEIDLLRLINNEHLSEPWVSDNGSRGVKRQSSFVRIGK